MAKRLKARWEAERAAGAADIASGSLAIVNPLRGQQLAVPLDVRLGETPEGEPAILWKVPPTAEDDEFGRVQQWGPGGRIDQAFWRFVELAEESDAMRFVDFVQRFGPLGLWPYTTPDGDKIFGLDYWVPSVTEGIYTPFRYTVIHSGEEERWLEEENLFGMLYEPIAEWRNWARWTKATLMIAFALCNGDLGARRDWLVLGYGFMFEPERLGPELRNFPSNQRLQRIFLTKWVQTRFLRWSGLAPVLRWDGERPEISLALGGDKAVLMPRHSMQWDWPENCLFPAIVAQLIALISTGGPVAVCSSCDRLHPRNRKPRADRPTYCSDHCREQAIRATKRRSAAKRRAIEKATAEKGSGMI